MARNSRSRRRSARLFVTTIFAVIVAAIVLLLAGSAAAMVAATGDGGGGPAIWTDQADYPPGATVTLTGAGWAAGEAVHIEVNDTIGKTWKHTADVAADDVGGFTDVFNLSSNFVSDYDATATGAMSGTATTTFTDSLKIDLDQCQNGPQAQYQCDTSHQDGGTLFDWARGQL